jgi:hypothetical protein
MGRAAIGAAAKSKTGSVRVTPAQYKMFEERFGGLGKFLQMQVNDQLGKWADEQQEQK